MGKELNINSCAGHFVLLTTLLLLPCGTSAAGGLMHPLESMPTVPAPLQAMYDAQVMRDLLAPMDSAEFFRNYYMTEPVHIHRANEVPLRFQTLFSFQDLDALLLEGGGTFLSGSSGALSLKSSNGTSLDPVLPAPGDADGDGEYTRNLLSDGTTIRLSLEKVRPEHLPAGTMSAVNEINMMLGGANISKAASLLWDGHTVQESDFRSSIHIYTTGPRKGARGLNPHTDTYDVFILQLEGTKKWTVCTPPALPRQPQPHEGAASAAGAPSFASTTTPPFPTITAAASSAEKAELHLQAQHKSDQCTFYTDESLAELDCTAFVLEAGDTYYMPKGLVHYAESTGTTSVHATISLDRKHSTWFDLVLDELVQNEAAGDGAVAWSAGVLEDMVEATHLGVRLAQLVPVGAAKLLPVNNDNSSKTERGLEHALEAHLDTLVLQAIAVSRSSQGALQANSRQHVQVKSNPIG
eukprot:gene14762-9407_t